MHLKVLKIAKNKVKDKINNLPEDTIEMIAMDIFDLEKIEDLEKYFG